MQGGIDISNINGNNKEVFIKLNNINEQAFNTLSLRASNAHPKNVDILNVLAKKPSKKSVKNNIIVQNAKVLEP